MSLIAPWEIIYVPKRKKGAKKPSPQPVEQDVRKNVEDKVKKVVEVHKPSKKSVRLRADSATAYNKG